MDFLYNLVKENENVILTIILIYLLLNGFAFAILSKNFRLSVKKLRKFFFIQLFIVVAACATFIMINQVFLITTLSIAILAIYYISLGIKCIIRKCKD